MIIDYNLCIVFPEFISYHVTTVETEKPNRQIHYVLKFQLSNCFCNHLKIKRYDTNKDRSDPENTQVYIFSNLKIDCTYGTDISIL